jgi:hypothetical protein
MTPAAIAQAIEVYFNTNWTDTPIAWPNVPFTAPDGSWARYQNLPDNTDTQEVGASGVGIREGVVKIQIFTKPNIGSRTGANLAATAEGLFHLQDISGVKFRSAYTTENGLNDAGTWYQHTVNAPWWAWVNE